MAGRIFTPIAISRPKAFFRATISHVFRCTHSCQRSAAAVRRLPIFKELGLLLLQNLAREVSSITRDVPTGLTKPSCRQAFEAKMEAA